MSELGTQRVYTSPFQGNPASIALDEQKINDVKQHAQKNPVGKIMGDVTEHNENPLDHLIKVFLCGAAAILPLKFFSEKFLEGKLFKDTLFNKLSNKIDVFSEQKLKFLTPVKDLVSKPVNWIKNSKTAKHFAVRSNDFKPLNGLAKGASRTIKEELTETLINFAKKHCDKIDAKKLENLSKKLSMGTISQQDVYKKVLKFADKLDNKGKFWKFSWKADNLKKFNVLNNKITAAGSKQGGSLISKALRPVYAGASRIVSLNPINLYFIGEVVKKTIDAPKGDKVSTFMEGLLGEVIAFWALMNATTRLPYQAIGGLKTFGKESFLGKIFGAPIRGIGHALGVGLTKDLTPNMSIKRAGELFKKAPTEKAKQEAVKRFGELSTKITEGKGGPKGMFGRLVNFDFRFWKGGSSTHKEIKQLFKSNVGIFKRIGLKLSKFTGGTGRLAVILFALMPMVAGILTKVSHKIFGKPQSAIDAENAEKTAGIQQNQSQIIDIDSKMPLVNDYLHKINGESLYSQTLTATSPLTTTPPLISDYINKKNISNAGQPLINKPKNNVDYSAAPAPIMTNPAITAQVNTAIADVDFAIKDAEKILGSNYTYTGTS